jgi:serine/threonine-protein kinase HipA
VADEADVRALAEARLWGRTVGALVELAGGAILFEYDEAFRRSGLEISPIELPLGRGGPLRFPELERKEAFRGLPGVFADALPDAFGRRVIRAYYAARGEPERALSPVQQLLYVGERALGALTFHPAEELRPAEEEALQVQALAHDARSIVEGKTAVAVPEIYRIGSSAGGRRPKAIVNYDPSSGRIRSGGAAPRPGEIPCLLKFDGIGEDHTSDALGSPQPYNRVEAAYGAMAREVGIDMATMEVLEVGDYAHLLVHRFDRRDGRRIHQHTFGGMIHVDYNEPGASSYEEFLRTIQELGMAHDALAEGFRRMVFNVVAVNQDDHVKNLSFHMDRDGTWSLAPAYDVTFARGHGWTRAHQMRVRDKTSGIRATDLLEVAREFGVKRADGILARTREVLGDWERQAAAFDVPPETASAIRRELDRRAEELDGRSD